VILGEAKRMREKREKRERERRRKAESSLCGETE